MRTGLLGIHCLSSLPMLGGRGPAGEYSAREIALPDCLKLVMQVSALQWRRLHGEIILFTDEPMRDYLDGEGMLESWSTVDTTVLGSCMRDNPDINHTVFWSAAKFACYAALPAPFCCIDTDVIVWKRLDIPEGVDWAFAHWESVEDDDATYPPLEGIQRPKGISTAMHHRDRAANMCITYMGNDSFRNLFANEAFAFMRLNNRIDPAGRYATPEILYMEQRLPLAVSRSGDFSCMPLVDSVWSPKQFSFVRTECGYENWFPSDFDESRLFTHLWFYKTYLREHPVECAAYEEKVRKKLCELLRDGI